MEPMKPSDRDGLLLASPLANAVDLMDEYERLLAERFSRDPDAPAPVLLASGVVADPEERIKELHDLLFGPVTP